MVKYFAPVLFCATACTNSFVMKPKTTGKPIMVGEIRQIGGEKKPHDAKRPPDFSTEIEILDTPTSASFDWELKQAGKLDDRLAAATQLGDRDAQITEVNFGSYVFFPVLFYFDKDWIRVSGYTEPLNFPVPDRVYLLYNSRVRDKSGKKATKKEKKKTTKKRRAR
jgi:hypothetical protein